MKMNYRMNYVWLTCVMVLSSLTSVMAERVLFRDNFNVYPGTPAEWATYKSEDRTDWDAHVPAGTNYLEFTFGTGSVAHAGITAAGQNEYESPKVCYGDDYISYKLDINSIHDWYSGCDLYVTAEKLTTFTDYNGENAGKNFRMKIRRNNSTNIAVTIFANGINKGSTTVIVPSGSTINKSFTLKLNYTRFIFLFDGVEKLSGTHGANMNDWGLTAYVNLNGWTQLASTSTSYIRANKVEIITPTDWPHFNDDFNEYPGTPAIWTTYMSSNNPDWSSSVPAGESYVELSFSTNAVAHGGITVAGNSSYYGPKYYTGTNYVSYGIYLKLLKGWYSGCDIYVTPSKLTTCTGYSGENLGHYFRVKMRRENSTTMSVTMYTDGTSKGTSNVTLAAGSDVKKYISLRINKTNFWVDIDAVTAFSGAHDADMSNWGEKAYMNLNEWSQGSGSIWGQVGYARIAATLPPPPSGTIVFIR